jgi:hypothetical protein
MNLSPTGVAVTEPTLWTNPDAARPVAAGFLPWRHWEVRADGSVVEHPAVRAVADVLGIGTGFPARRFTPTGRDVRRLDGSAVDETVEVSYGMDSDLWLRFAAKTALGCATKLFDDDWLDQAHRAAQVRRPRRGGRTHAARTRLVDGGDRRRATPVA